VWFDGENVSLNIEFKWINNIVKWQRQRQNLWYYH